MSDAAFWTWLKSHQAARPVISLEALIQGAGGPQATAVIGVDLIEGFCRNGPLASPRISALLSPTVKFLRDCHQQGIKDFFFPSDAHQADSPEFEAFPPHCIQGTTESQLALELRSLEFSHLFERVDKRSVASLTETPLGARLRGKELRTLICIGDCTDLCLYHLATGLRFLANSAGLAWNIVVPANLVATYDLPVDIAEEIGAMPHPGDIMHDLFLYHLELNGVKVITLGAPAG